MNKSKLSVTGINLFAQESMVPIFKLQTAKQKQKASEKIRTKQIAKLHETRQDNQREVFKKGQLYSKRLVDARNSMSRGKMLGISPKKISRYFRGPHTEKLGPAIFVNFLYIRDRGCSL
mmetsp:Transcript_7562/g.29851  ORF Transcript_7562/g.29851 Transcript_7562/m.29851 type:complete len:119 (-) Transcript_7562:630-986(-)